jgi:hypothetical protein
LQLKHFSLLHPQCFPQIKPAFLQEQVFVAQHFKAVDEAVLPQLHFTALVGDTNTTSDIACVIPETEVFTTLGGSGIEPDGLGLETFPTGETVVLVSKIKHKTIKQHIMKTIKKIKIDNT